MVHRIRARLVLNHETSATRPPSENPWKAQRPLKHRCNNF
jgi:hypothetical protein